MTSLLAEVLPATGLPQKSVRTLTTRQSSLPLLMSAATLPPSVTAAGSPHSPWLPGSWSRACLPVWWSTHTEATRTEIPWCDHPLRVNTKIVSMSEGKKDWGFLWQMAISHIPRTGVQQGPLSADRRGGLGNGYNGTRPWLLKWLWFCLRGAKGLWKRLTNVMAGNVVCVKNRFWK